ncbi:Hypothetical protein CINCED_3A010978 [Cinara cedri]|uniref:Uncharacterized protein n=1 Tax=Cinara cedri TaxID=506608 RepID=A0A5E4M8K1_9HEMI|nr:Hypothetical protein CINCED_3A010978 [Cinara cedri]
MLFCKIFLSIYFCISFTFGCNYTNDEMVLLKTFSSSNKFFDDVSNLFIYNPKKFLQKNQLYETKWVNQYKNDYKEERIKYGVGLKMCNLFATHIQCSQAITAYRFVRTIMDNIKLIKGNNDNKEILGYVKTVGLTYYGNVTELMDMMYVLGYVPPKYMVLSSLYSKEVADKANLVSFMAKFFDDNLNNMGNVAMDTAKKFIKQCDAILEDGIIDRLSTEHVYPISDFNKYLYTIHQNLNNAKQNLVKIKDSNRFNTENWILNELFTNKESLNMFFWTQATYLNIDWNKLQTKLINTYTLTQKADCKLNIYNNSRREDSHQNKLKQVYRTVVNRYILIVVLDCNYLHDKVMESKEKLETTCRRIETVINGAINFLQEDVFLTELLPVVQKFIKEGSVGAWDVFNMVISELTSLSTILEVEAGNAYTPDELLTIENGVEITNVHLDEAIKYTETLKGSFADQFFDVINVIQSSVNNEWIMSTKTIEKERTELLIPNFEQEKKLLSAEPPSAGLTRSFSKSLSSLFGR